MKHSIEVISNYFSLYGRRIAADAPPPPRSHDKSKKASRKGMKAKS